MGAIATQIPNELHFHLVEKSSSIDALINRLYSSPSDLLKQHFKTFNQHLKNNQVRAGQIAFITPPDSQQCTQYDAEMSELAAYMDTQAAQMNEQEAEIISKRYELLGNIAQYGGVGYGAGLTYFAQYKKGIETVLSEIEQLYLNTYKQQKILNTAAFFSKRKILFMRLDNLLKSMAGNRLVGIAPGNIKQSLGLSSKSVVHQLNQAGGSAKSIPGFKANYNKVTTLGKTLKWGGYAGIGLNIGQGGLNIHEACTIGNEHGCGKTVAREVPGVAGSIGGGVLGGTIGYGLCNAVFGLPSGGTSLVWCAVVGGGSLGYGLSQGAGWLGRTSGQIAYETIYRD